VIAFLSPPAGLCFTLSSEPIFDLTFFRSGAFAKPIGALMGGSFFGCSRLLGEEDVNSSLDGGLMVDDVVPPLVVDADLDGRFGAPPFDVVVVVFFAVDEVDDAIEVGVAVDLATVVLRVDGGVGRVVPVAVFDIVLAI